MPTYEYLCQTCSHRFETWQKMTDEPLTTCPECGNHIRRVLYPAGVVFKGSGFYKTDHAEKKAAAPSGNGETKSSETKSGEGTSESKTSSETKSSESSTSKPDSTSTASTAPSTATK